MAEPTGSIPTAVLRGAVGRCPDCGRGPLFDGFIALRPSCDSCGLDYGFADAGDGPAVFVTLIGGFITLGFALWLEFAFEPPFWVHLLVSLPAVVIVCLALLRLMKGVLITLQRRNAAAEARLER
ncbi:hypothetical protein GCM10008171_21890 [Methylopila jiangsuensis]|uniref:DUF983 domain-containing protein n=1 Tax=Methylopila jiangsuensis TaxID=586230 RepID=A0A9W6JG24_9HYPH|nr:DUF983 domain-containing protein [Methylopila jiangsuensis]MDR6286720.1 uncharacterized protein (DUF983 family) [Methylopila jiangsuensis]GLK76935.1 hypothetical protein GCM10008171_21890 [Methylopila jiangsuensis]